VHLTGTKDDEEFKINYQTYRPLRLQFAYLAQNIQWWFRVSLGTLQMAHKVLHCNRLGQCFGHCQYSEPCYTTALRKLRSLHLQMEMVGVEEA
jgi:hypothetical protein